MNPSKYNILISGASIAGPALAFWLTRYGFNVTLVELSPALRTGGYKVDIRGKAVEVAKAMGLYEKIRQQDVDMQKATFVDEQGKVVSEMAASYLGMKEPEDVELLRGDLSRILYESAAQQCEYLFNNNIKSIEQNEKNVTVELTNGESRHFDLIIGADGIHSNVRNLIFGNEADFSYDPGGYFYAIFTMENYFNLVKNELFYAKIGKLINIYSTHGNDAKVLFVFRSPEFQFNYRDVDSQKKQVRKIYGNEGWEIARLLEAMDKSSDFYFDIIKQIRMPHWYKNRAILIGDAAYSPTLASGQGTSLALVASYVLAGELRTATDYKQAFQNYEKEMRPFVTANQALGEVIIRQMVPEPQSRWQLIMNKLLSSLPTRKNPIDKLRTQTKHAANCITIKKY